MSKYPQKLYFSIFLVVILIMTSIDIFQDSGKGQDLIHLSSEIAIVFSVLIGLVYLWFNTLFLKSELKISIENANKWKTENADLISGLSSAIDRQLELWQLTPSEKEVTLLLLKGLSFKMIAEIRSVSERTVRKQSINVYQKSNLAGRAELSAFFLEDLLK
jgi:DNA-binding CsgD family transcriptional regulator